MPESKNNPLSVGLTEQMVLNYGALPPELDGWRNYRIEYGGHAEACVMEKVVYLPPCGDPDILELLFELWQEPGWSKRKDIYHKIVKELNINRGQEGNG